MAATSGASETPASGDGARRFAMLLAALGLAISAYLAAVGLTAAGLPIGCGAGGGCASVLGSRWAGSWGVPVGVPAAALWVLALIAAAARMRGVLAFAACGAAIAALWFVVVQLAVVGAICPWCMADHLIALAFAAVVFGGRLASPRGVPCAAAVAACAIVIAGQFAVVYRPGKVGLLGAGQAGGAGITVAGFEFGPGDAPSWGAADGEATIVLLADYACPHCRATHGYLAELLAAAPRRFRILVAPVPMDHRCNRTLASTEPRFEHSCELAQLAIALWRADATRFAAFDSWLFEPETPRTPEDAKAEAERLVGAEALAKAIADSPLPAIIARNVDAFEAVHAQRLPVILRASGPSIEGEPASRDELDTLLRTDTPRR